MEGLELYGIVLDGFVEVLYLHGIKEVEIPNTLTLSTAEKCIEKIQNTSHNSDYAKCSDDIMDTVDSSIENVGTVLKDDIIRILQKHFA